MPIDEEIEGAIKLINKPFDVLEGVSFSKCCPIYIGTNENQRELLNIFDVKEKDVLGCTASGDFPLNCLANGAKSVTVFDQNVLAKHLLSLKVAAILTYSDVSDFAKFFTTIKNSNDLKESNFFDKRSFINISSNLCSDSLKFWKTLYDLNNPNFFGNSSFFRRTLMQLTEIQRNANHYYDEDKYQILRERLKRTNIQTIDASITDLPYMDFDKDFDFIYLSNILQYYRTIKEIDSFFKVHDLLEKCYMPLLKANGSLGVCYTYVGDFNLDKKENLTNLDINYNLLVNFPETYKFVSFPAAARITVSPMHGLVLSKKR